MDIIKKYFLAMLIGIVVSVGLIFEADEFANPNMFKVGLIVLFFFFTGIVVLIIDEMRKNK